MAIEQAALRAWPAREDVRIGSWIVRVDAGYTKRANCIYGWGEPGLDLDRRIEECSAVSRAAGLPVIVREASWNPVPGLAEFAATRNILPFDQSIVMTRPLAKPQGWSTAPAPEVPLSEWLDCYLRFEGGTKGNQATHREILERINRPVRLAVHLDEDIPVSIGLAVADGTLAGLYDIATDPACRGRGFGSLLVEGMLAWGIGMGCDTAYLQVMAANSSAVRLYARLGFTEAFRYHYYRLEKPS